MSKRSDHILSSPIEYLKGVGPQRADLLKKELGIFTFRDLLELYPNRHIDKTVISLIKDLNPLSDWVQVAGRLSHLELSGDKRARRLVGQIEDDTGRLELVWFQGISWIHKALVPGQRY